MLFLCLFDLLPFSRLHLSLCIFDVICGLMLSLVADRIVHGCQTKSVVLMSSHHFFGRCHIQFFVAKLATAALSKGTHPVLLEKNKNKFGEGFPQSKFVQSRCGFIFVGIPLYYGTFSCLAVLSTVKFKY